MPGSKKKDKEDKEDHVGLAAVGGFVIGVVLGGIVFGQIIANFGDTNYWIEKERKGKILIICDNDEMKWVAKPACR